MKSARRNPFGLLGQLPWREGKAPAVGWARVIGLGQVNLSLSSTPSAVSKIRFTPHMRSVDRTMPRRGYTLPASKAIAKA
jgi:hypothetical protein